MSEHLSILLVDDHAVVREGYKRLLERAGDISVVGEAANAAEAYQQFCKINPQIVIMDISLPGASGIDALRHIRAREPAARVLMFSMYGEPIFARRALDAGAMGYLTKASAPEELIEAVRSVARDERYLSRDIAQSLALQPTGVPTDTEELSPREFEVLGLWLQGKSLGEIATALVLSPKTIANHQSSIKQKLHAETTAQLWLNARRRGLIPEQAVPPVIGIPDIQ